MSKYVELAASWLMDQSTGGNWARLNEAESDTTALANTIKDWKRVACLSWNFKRVAWGPFYDVSTIQPSCWTRRVSKHNLNSCGPHQGLPVS